MSRRKGFTLIELLVVIAIIAILAAILFPVFTKAQEKAKQTQCQSNLMQIGKGMKMYGDDWDGKYPWATEWAGDANCPSLYTVLTKKKYVSSPNVFHCPSDVGKVSSDGMTTNGKKTYWEAYGSSYNWPGATYIGRWPYLTTLNQSNPIIPNAPTTGNQGRVWHLSVSQRVMVFDGTPAHYLENKGVASWTNLKGFTNVCYCDGHAKALDYRTLLYQLGINDTP